MQWRLLLEEYNPKVVHVAGPNNEAADALSRLDMDDNDYDELEWNPPNPPLSYSDAIQQQIQLLYPMASEQTMDPTTGFPLAPDLIRHYQQQDKQLRLTARTNPRFTIKDVEKHPLILNNDKIVIPDALQARILDWYRQILVHPGET